MKNSNETIGNRTRYLPTCSAVPLNMIGCRHKIILSYMLKRAVADQKCNVQRNTFDSRE